MPSEPHPNGRSVAPVCQHSLLDLAYGATTTGAHEGVGQAARKLWPEEVITDRYHCLASIAEVFAALKAGNNLQRVIQFVAVGIGARGGQLPVDSDGFLARGQRVLRPRNAG